MFRSNYMSQPVGVMRVPGLSQCYMCGYGENCADGAVVSRHGVIDQIRDYPLPVVSQDAYCRAEVIAHRLGEVVRNKKNYD